MYPPTLNVCVTVSVLDTVYIFDLTFLVVKLTRFQFQILFSNILYFSGFSEDFVDYFGKSLSSVSAATDNRL